LISAPFAIRQRNIPVQNQHHGVKKIHQVYISFSFANSTFKSDVAYIAHYSHESDNNHQSVLTFHIVVGRQLVVMRVNGSAGHLQGEDMQRCLTIAILSCSQGWL